MKPLPLWLRAALAGLLLALAADTRARAGASSGDKEVRSVPPLQQPARAMSPVAVDLGAAWHGRRPITVLSVLDELKAALPGAALPTGKSGRVAALGVAHQAATPVAPLPRGWAHLKERDLPKVLERLRKDFPAQREDQSDSDASASRALFDGAAAQGTEAATDDVASGAAPALHKPLGKPRAGSAKRRPLSRLDHVRRPGKAGRVARLVASALHLASASWAKIWSPPTVAADSAVETAALDARPVRREIDYLNGLGAVRVYFANAPGFGHQSATLSVIRRLRDLGYTGAIDAVYDDDTAAFNRDFPSSFYDGVVSDAEQPAHFGSLKRKLAELLPEFRPDGPKRQRLESLDITIRPTNSIDSESEPLALGLTAGADSSDDFAETLNVRKFLRLGPMDWGGYADKLWLPGRQTIEISGNRERALIYSPAKEGVIDDAYFDGLNASKYPQAKRRGLAALARAAARSDLLPAYGLAFMHPVDLLSVVLGAFEARQARPDLFTRHGTIIPLLLDNAELSGPFEDLMRDPGSSPRLRQRVAKHGENAVKAVERLRAHLRVVSIDDPDIERKLAALEDSEIMVLKTGPVPPAFFEWLFNQATLPPTLEGKNSMNLARMLGIPYIPVLTGSKGDLDQHLKDIRGKGEHSKVERHLSQVVPALGKLNFGAIADYIVDAMTPGSGLRRLFSSAMIRQDDYHNDKLIMGLRAAMAAKANDEASTERILGSVP